MDRILRARPSPATLIALVALFVALGGTAFSALRVDSSKVVNNSLKSADLKNKKGVKDVDVVPNGLTGKAINEATLSGVNAATANSANSATTASNADMLDNLDSADFLRSNAAAAGDLSGNYPSPSIATNAVNSAKIADGSVDTGDLSAGALGARAYGRVNQNGTLSNSKNVASVTALGGGSYCITPAAGIDPSTAVVIVAPEFVGNSTNASLQRVSHVEWDSIPSPCPSTALEVLTYLYDGDPTDDNTGGDVMTQTNQSFAFMIP